MTAKDKYLTVADVSNRYGLTGLVTTDNYYTGWCKAVYGNYRVEICRALPNLFAYNISLIVAQPKPAVEPYITVYLENNGWDTKVGTVSPLELDHIYDIPQGHDIWGACYHAGGIVYNHLFFGATSSNPNPDRRGLNWLISKKEAQLARALSELHESDSDEDVEYE